MEKKLTNLDFRFLDGFDDETVILSEVKEAATLSRGRKLSKGVISTNS